MNPSLLFVSRGRGYGHAIPDMAIAEELLRLRPATAIHFASYSSGLEALKARGHHPIDLGLPERNRLVEVLRAVHLVLLAHRPSLVVAHEEFGAILAADLLAVRSVFVSAWLPLEGTNDADALAGASAIAMLNEPGVFPVPSAVRVDPDYTGLLVRKMLFTAANRGRLRAELGWHPDDFCVLVVPGGSEGEAHAPMAEIVISAYKKLPFARKRLVWISSADFDAVAKYRHTIEGFEPVKFTSPIERLLSAADVIISRGTCGVTLDAQAVGVPSISISHGFNPIDDIIVPRIRTNTPLVAGAFTPDHLATLLQQAHSSPSPPVPAHHNEAARKAAAVLARELDVAMSTPSQR